MDGIVVGQSKSIERVVAKKYGSASVETEVDKFFVTDLPEWFHKVEKALKLTSTTPGVAVGSNLSHADLSIYYTLVFYWGANAEVVKKAYANCELIRWNFLSALSNNLV